MNVLWGNNPAVNEMLWKWASMKLFEHTRGFGGACHTMGVFDGTELIGVMVYHNYDRKAGAIEVSGAADNPRWLTRKVLWDMFAYPFEQLDCQIVVMRVSPENRHLHRILTAYGFDCYTIPRLRGRHEDELIFTLTDDAWRNNGFHRNHRNGQRSSGTPGPSRDGSSLHLH